MMVSASSSLDGKNVWFAQVSRLVSLRGRKCLVNPVGRTFRPGYSIASCFQDSRRHAMEVWRSGWAEWVMVQMQWMDKCSLLRCAKARDAWRKTFS